jgi:hypothetical protein
MDIRDIRNEHLIGTDFAAKERAAFLQAVPGASLPKPVELAPGISAEGIWMTDVSGMDRRSVKTQLAKKGSLRATWWDLNCWVHQRLRPDASMEQIMFAFHRRQHALTFLRLECTQDFLSIMAACKDHGLLVGIRHAAILAAKSSGGRS